MARAAVLWNSGEDKSLEAYWRELHLAAGALGISLRAVDVRSPEDLDEASRPSGANNPVRS